MENKNNGNLIVLKQDSYYSLWLNYNKCPACVLETFFAFQTTLSHIM